ncbi:MAG TPA: DUF2298 domain-containing protein, partial [Roseiflexaceae bacterium]|nr:DUF2298 domain-containing protein [Roseiflexaceae bacterium]
MKLIFSKTIRVWAARGSLGRIGDLLDRPGAVVAGLALVLLIAALFRFNGLSWDSDQKLHPDERFLISVTDDLRWPDTFETYFDPQTSTLSPYALPDMGLFVYGTLPVYLVKSTAILLDVDTEDAITLIGRSLSALFDLGTILFLFLIGRQLYGSKVGLLAAILLSLSVLDIQLAHFYAVDTFACFFVVATIYVILRASSSGRWSTYALAGLLFGLGLASKLSAAILAVPIGLGLAIDLARRLRDGNDARRAFGHTLARALTVFAIAALVFRVVQPIAFAGPGFWNWSLNSRWLADIDEQRLIIAGEEDMPWLQQWAGRSASFALYNIVIWGLGVPLGLAALAGLGLAIYDLIWRRRLEHLLPAAFVAVMFAYHASAFAKFMRYFLPIYPFLALMAAWLLVRILDFRFRIFERLPTIHNPKSKIAWLPLLLVVSATLLYALAFSAIYSQPHTRVAASRWMFANIAPGATLANEAWDDWLPLDVDGKVAFGKRGLFKDVELPNYDDDTPDKLDQLVDYLTQADYVVLSSNRLYDSIPRLPLRYPMTSRYYALLLAGELGFERVAQFVSYPTLFGIQIPDQAAEESFTVYDHPRVQIFKKTPAFDTEQARRLLGDGVDWDMALPIGPRQASAAPAGLLLSKPERDLYQQAAQWSSAGVSDLSWGSQWPALAWFLAIQALGMLALTPTLVACGHLTDRGYSFSKAIGLLIVGWGAWLLASVRTAPFASPTIVAVMALLAIATWLLRARWAELIAFARARWRLLLLEEILFWCFFALALAIRWRNPDLWHPFLGGQKPMDLAYLTAIVRTPYFPAYDPWFAGGYINYSYFGFTLVATLIHLTGVVPAIAYNLAVPMCFAMTALGGFALALNLAEGRDGTHSTEPPDQG